MKIEKDNETIYINIKPYSGWTATRTLIKLFNYGFKNIAVFDAFDMSGFKDEKDSEDKKEQLRKTLKKDIDFKKIASVIMQNSDEKTLVEWIEKLTYEVTVSIEKHGEESEGEAMDKFELKNKTQYDMALEGRVYLLFEIIPEVLKVNYGALSELWGKFMDFLKEKGEK